VPETIAAISIPAAHPAPPPISHSSNTPTAQTSTRRVTRSYARRLHTTYRDDYDALPEAPAPLLDNTIDTSANAAPIPPTPHTRVRLTPFETPIDSFGRYRIYPSKPLSIPDSDCVLADYSEQSVSNESTNPLPSKLSLREAIAPLPNLSTFYFLRWFWKGSNKSITSREELVNDVILNPQFNPQDLDGVNLRTLDKKLAASTSLPSADDLPTPSGGWVQKTVSIRVPITTRKSKGVRSKLEQLGISGLHARSILDGIRKGFKRNKKRHFHYNPYESKWVPPGTAKSNTQTISDEMYTSPAMLEAHKEVQQLKIADSSCELPRVVAAVMLGSDGLQLGAFSTKKAWVLYMWLGNLSKYERSKPNSGSCFELAHIPSLPDAIKDEITKSNGRPPTANLIIHLRRELMHAVLHELLDAEFLRAWRHGIVVTCADGIKRRVFPRLFTYAADYPERVLLATIRDKGLCPCPQCLVPMELIHRMGSRSDMQRRIKTLRRDNLRRQKVIQRARGLIYDQGKAIGNAEVEALLQPESLVPTENAFSRLLLPLKFEFYSIFVVDLLHEVELGVWKSLLTHLIRILYSCGSETIAEFNRRFRLVPTFSNSTIRKFSEDVASLKRLAARDFEDVLQCCIPVFKGLLPNSIDAQTQRLLFCLTRWHALAKLRQHTSATLRHLSIETTKLGDKMREFEAITAGLVVFETPREFRARQRRAAAKTQNQPHTNEPKTLTRKQCKLNLNTFKFHALGDYVAVIARNGTTDSFSTQATELQHRKIKSQWFRTNKREAVSQMTKIGDIGDAIDVIQERLDKHAQSGTGDKSTSEDWDNAEPYYIGQSDRAADAVNIPLWVHSQSHNPATKFFFTSLKQHLLSRLTGDPEPTELGKIAFQNDRMYSHATMRVNYTSYDIRRQYDIINPKSPCRNILLPSDTSNDPETHTFLYARVLGIYHANVRFCGRPPKRMDFLWVRWLDYDEAEPGGWDIERLDRVSYGKCRNDSELLDAFGFVDPQHVVRATHLIPDFDSGTVGPTCFASVLSRFVCDNSEGDWKHHYVNRFVDRDMTMRYLGGGIGHFNQYVTESQNLGSDTSYEYIEEEAEDIELAMADEGSSSRHPESSEVNDGVGPDEDSEDAPDLGSDEEGNLSLSDEEDFVDDLYDL
ncbi:hypothetical protein FRC12_015532, partial [Ceratobasidium sp. 428]